MIRRGLVVCSANVCRSPVAERLLQRAVEGRRDIDGCRWSITSAGVGPVDVPMDRHTAAAAAQAGIDLTDHEARLLDDGVLATDGADLVLVMSRAQLRYLTGREPGAWSRTFTLKELARRAAAAGPPQPGDDLEAWLQRVSVDRRAAELMTPNRIDDVVDPYGHPRREHVAMVTELARAVDQLADCGFWGHPRP